MATIEEYLAAVDDGRRGDVGAVVELVRRNLPEGYGEGIQYGMIGWFVPHERYPAGYHCDPRQPVPFIGLAAQKRHLSLYLFCAYVEPSAREAFEAAYRATGKPMDMGKGCVRFRRYEDLPHDLIARTVAEATLERFLAAYEAGRPAPRPRRA